MIEQDTPLNYFKKMPGNLKLEELIGDLSILIKIDQMIQCKIVRFLEGVEEQCISPTI